MKSYKVKDLMVPLSEYATVSEDASIFEAVEVLEKAQESFDQTKYRHRAILVFDKSKKIVGKLGQMDILRTLEPKYEDMQGGHGLASYGFSKRFMKSILEQYRLFDKPMEDICRKAGTQKVSQYMHSISEGEFVDENSSLDEAIHMIVLGHHQSLLVTREGISVGILRMTDVFSVVIEAMKKCRI